MFLVNHNFKINFNYRFGKLDVQKVPKKTHSVKNDDLMGGGAGNGAVQEGDGAPQAAPKRNRKSENSKKQKAKKSRKKDQG